MNVLEVIGLIFAAVSGAVTALMRQYKIGPWNRMASTDNDTVIELSNEALKPDLSDSSSSTSDTASTTESHGKSAVSSENQPYQLLWDTPRHAYHSTRVICDEMGLSVSEKNLICAVIYGESEFYNTATCKNRDKNGFVTSIDAGLCQINSYFHTGKGKDFPSIEYVVAHPEEAVRWMVKMYKGGYIKQWVAYSSGRYLQFLKDDSPMWKLAA